MAEKSNTPEFVRKAQELWGDRWDYREVEYVNSLTPVVIGCKEHGKFQQTPKSHLKKKAGCVACSRKAISTSKILDSSTFFHRAAEVWGDRWDYSNTIYAGTSKQVRVVCREHGEFIQKASHHLGGHIGCHTCRSQWGEYLSLDRFKVLAGDVWNRFYDYSSTKFTPGSSIVEILCPLHGTFSCNKYEHLKGVGGCRKCSGRVYDGESFKRVSSELWGGKYNYYSSEYVNTKEKVIITCPEHGNFYQSPETHLQGKVGCRSCLLVGTSKGEQQVIDFIQSVDVLPVHRATRRLSNPNIELDIYIPEKRVAFEFNGVYWHSSKFREKDYHKNKFELAKEVGIKLIQIWEDDWVLRRPIMEEHIRQVLGVSKLPKIAARKTQVQELKPSEAKRFLTRYHIQGGVGASHHLSLQFEGETVALASFKSTGKGDYELVRYATSANVQGGHSKLVTYFERNYEYRHLITFADLTFGDGGLYRSTGWVEDKSLRPDYSYLVGNQRVHKFNYRLKRFREDPLLEFVEGMTESELADLNGLLRIYDAGKIRFIKPHPKHPIL